MYVQEADFHAVPANETDQASQFFDQSLTVAHVYNFECQLNRFNQLKPETPGQPLVGLSNSVVGKVTEENDQRPSKEFDLFVSF